MSRRTWLLTLTGVAAIAVVVAAREVLLPFILALVLAYVFTPAVLRLQRRGVPRWVAILGIYALTLGGIYAFFALTAPRLVAEMREFGRELPKNVKHIEEVVIPSWQAKIQDLTGGGTTAAPAPSSSDSAPEIAPAPAPSEDEHKSALRVTPRDDGSLDVDVGSGVVVRPTDDGGYKLEPVETKKKGSVAKIVAYIERNTMDIVKGGITLITGIARSIFLFFMTLMLAAYMMLTYEQIFAFFRGLVRPTARHDFDRLLTRIDQGLAGVVRGQLLICLVNGVISAVGFAVIGLKYWPVMALIAAVGSLIPIFGSILSSIPAVAIGLTQSLTVALLVLGWILAIHQVEANFLNPRIIGTQAHLHPVMIVFVLLAGEHWFQATGALLAVPVLSITRSLFLHFREVADRDTGWSSDAAPAAAPAVSASEARAPSPNE